MIRTVSLACVCTIYAATALHQACAGYGSLRAISGTVEALRSATRSNPTDAALRRRLGIALLPRNPAKAEESFRSAAALNPYDSDSLLALGLLAESRRELPLAERYLIRATRISRRLRPRTELAAFYWRHRDEGRFWDIAREAVAIEAADASRVFEMAHEAEPDPAIVPRLLRPPTDGTRTAYLSFALARNYNDAAAKIAPAISPSPRSRDLLILTCERLIDAGLAPDAVRVWNRLAGANLVDANPLRPESGISLTNGAFQRSDFCGFNWRRSASEGVESAFDTEGLRIELSAHRSEKVALVQQFVPVVPERKYRLTCRYAITDLTAPTGLRWRVLATASDAEVASHGGVLDAVSGGDVALEFETPPAAQIVRLVLTYDRPAGSVRGEGVVVLKRADLRLIG